MPESTEEKKTGIIETVMGIVGTKNEGKPIIHYHPVDLTGKPTISKENAQGLVYDENGKPKTEPLLGNVVDVEV